MVKISFACARWFSTTARLEKITANDIGKRSSGTSRYASSKSTRKSYREKKSS